jgi:hypothetical protein
VRGDAHWIRQVPLLPVPAGLPGKSLNQIKFPPTNHLPIYLLINSVSEPSHTSVSLPTIHESNFQCLFYSVQWCRIKLIQVEFFSSKNGTVPAFQSNLPGRLEKI